MTISSFYLHLILNYDNIGLNYKGFVIFFFVFPDYFEPGVFPFVSQGLTISDLLTENHLNVED